MGIKDWYDIFFSNKQTGGSLSNDVVKSYNAGRFTADKKHLCNAPFNNMYFNVLGQVGPCWLTYLGGDTFPEKSLHDIWFGERYDGIRQQIRNRDLSGQCATCKFNIEHGNYVSVLASAYDVVPVAKYPTMMEFELGNTCNLECVMCKGELSSSIRKNREKLPPVKSPYNDSFVEQLKEFIPHLKEARFNGGEPFLININFHIWEQMLAINPAIKITIATNGSVLNYKVKDILERGSFLINLSLDGFSKESYEEIRVNGKFDRVMENLLYFHDYCKRKGTILCIMTNPMRQNWWEMPLFVDFCNKLNIPLWFNTVDYPVEYSLSGWDVANLEKVYAQLSDVVFENKHNTDPHLFERNVGIYNNFAKVQLKAWLDEARKRSFNPENSNTDDAMLHKLFESIQQQSGGAIVENRKTLIKHINLYLQQVQGLPELERMQKLYVCDKKITDIYSKVKDRIKPEDYYQLLLQHPVNAVYDTLQQNTVEWATERVKELI